MNSTSSPATTALLEQLRTASDGLLYISESDYPFEVVHFPQVQNRMDVIAALYELPEVEKGAEVETVELSFFFRNMTREEPEAGEGGNTASRYRELQALLEQHLQEVKVYRVGHRKIQAFILGKTAAGDFAGLKTTVVET